MAVGSLKKNTIWVLAEFAFATAIQFLIIRHIIHQLGAAQMGVWAVLMSVAQVAGFLDLGLTAGVARYLAKAQFSRESGEVEKVLAIIVHITVPLYIALSIIIYYVTWLLLPHIIEARLVDLARYILRYSTVSYFFLVLSIACGACLNGLHLGFRKSQLYIFGTCVQAMLVWSLVEQYGLAGIAVAQVVNYLLIIFGTLMLFKFAAGLKLSGLLSFKWQQAKEVMRFGAGLQLPSIAWALFETSIRFFMSRFGGAEQMGRYEIAYRVAAQARILFFYVSQPLGPALVTRHLQGASIFGTFYRGVYSRFSFLALGVMIGLIVISPLVSWFMLSAISPQYIIFQTLTAVGAAVHIWAMPAENAAVSQGKVRWNAIGTFSAVIVMLTAGIPAGIAFGGYGVAACVLIASITAGVIPVLGNNRLLGLPLRPSPQAALSGLRILRWSRKG